MKNEKIVKSLLWVLAAGFAAALALSACSSTDEHPSGHSEHPTKEHPGTNAPAKSP